MKAHSAKAKPLLNFAGRDLSPLPFESTASLLLRFGWRNCLSAAQLRELSSNSHSYPFIVNNDKFQKASGWVISSIEKELFKHHLCDDTTIWQEKLFRYCPICLEHGYHTFWFQFSLLRCCPIHNIELGTRCHSCDTELARYPSSKKLMERSYYCAECHLPISGAPPTIDAHLQFRYQTSELLTVFQPYLEWWRQTSERRTNIQWLCPWTGEQKWRTTWCYDEEFMRSVVCFDLPTPQYFSRTLYSDITVLSWRIEHANHETSLNLFPLDYSWKDHVKNCSAGVPSDS